MQTREALDRLIKELTDEILTLESLVSQAANDAVKSLLKQKTKKSKSVYERDRIINEKRYQIEEKTLIAIATQQPLATDLRLMAAILEISSELERMGDYAKGIARINIMVADEELLKPMADLKPMAEIAIEMLTSAIRAFVDRDLEAAYQIPEMDEEVDRLFNKIHYNLIKQMIKDETTIERANHLQWAAHNLERMADRVTNICERTIFVITGELVELDQTDDELHVKKKINGTKK